jgi:SpoVK/Ycf46/Vps4 family AAA+-type ATPase
MSDASNKDRFVDVLRARHPCVSIVTGDEGYAMDIVVAVAMECGRKVLSWSTVRGICEGLFSEQHEARADSMVAARALRQFVVNDHANVMVMLDLVAHLDDKLTLRAARELIDHCRKLRTTLVLIDHHDRLPEILERSVVRFEMALPNDDEMGKLVLESLNRLKADEPGIGVSLTKSQFQQLTWNLRGLTRIQAHQVIADLAVEDNSFNDLDVKKVLTRKRKLLHRAGLLEFVEVPVSLDDIAGMSGLKRWLKVRERALNESVPADKLELPRGVLLLGVPGSGKSLCAKAIATAWQRPLLRLDTGVLYDKFVGESERRLRDALQQAEAMAPMVLWIDEIEKAFASSMSGNTSDGGLSQRMFGSLLTWMQERSAAVFLVATANAIEALPPELLRKGRFDEIFFIDLPDAAVRCDLFRIHLRKRGYDPDNFHLDALAALADRFSGAEVEQAIASAQIECFAAGHSLDEESLAHAISATTPLAVTMAERVKFLREWAEGRCVKAEG